MRGSGKAIFIFLIGIMVVFGCSSKDEKKTAYYDRGTAYFEKGEYKNAELELKNAIQIDPNFAQAYEKLGETYLKLGNALSNSFLFESVQGGEQRGRYSIIGLKPDLIWRCRDGKAEINKRAAVDPNTFTPDALADRPLESLKKLIHSVHMDLPDELPPMSVALFGYLGYDLVRHMERLPPPPPDVLGLPEAIVIRPTITAIFDSIRDEIILVTPVWPDQNITARAAYEKGCERLEQTIADFEKELRSPTDVDIASLPDGPVESNTTHDEYLDMVRKAKEYILAGDIFQVVPSQRFRRPFTLPPFSLYRALRRTNPSPFLYFLNFPDFAIVGSSPEILVRLRDETVTIRPIAGTRPRGKTVQEDQHLAAELDRKSVV